MRYFVIILSFALASCIKIGTSDLSIHEWDQTKIAQQEIQRSTDFWGAMQDFDFAFVKQYPDSSDHQNFSNALQFMLDGEFEMAEPLLEQIVDSTQDSLFQKESGILLAGIYMLTYNWDKMIDLDEKLPEGIDDLGTISMVKAWHDQKEETIKYPKNPMMIPSEKSIAGIPMIQVLVNGVEQTFWVDTGAGLTVLASDIAEDCGVEPLTEVSSEVGTSTDKQIGLWPGMIDELKIDELVIENHPVFIIAKEDLEFKLFKVIRLLKIDGILGWNAIQKLKLEINAVENSILFEKPESKDYGTKNFFYFTQPFVAIHDTLGNPMNFFLDTGSNKTGLYDPAFAYFDTTSAKVSSAVVGGAGGTQKVRQFTLTNQSLIQGSNRIFFPELHGGSQRGNTDEDFPLFDGILGSDVSAGGITTLDFQNGYFELKRIESNSN